MQAKHPFTQPLPKERTFTRKERALYAAATQWEAPTHDGSALLSALHDSRDPLIPFIQSRLSYQ